MKTPRVFVGSATEASDIDRQVTAILETLGATVVGWRQMSMPGDYPLEGLLKLVDSVDAALLIATPDDLTQYRGGQRPSPRDNVLLELGMFLSQFGKRRTGILHVKAGSDVAALPSDLHGITTIAYDPANPNKNERKLSIWLDGVKREAEKEHPAVPQVLKVLRSTFSSVDPTWTEEIERYILGSFVSALRLAAQGQIVLSPGEYFQAIYEEVDNASADCEISGVATLSSAFWSDDRDQQRYVNKNIDASKRGANIRRLFIIRDQDWGGFYPVIRKQLEAGINIRRAAPTILAEITSLEDMVLFVDRHAGVSRAYIGDRAFDNPSLIRRGRLVLNPGERGDLLGAFERAWATATVVTVRDVTEPGTVEHGTAEPGRSMKEFALAAPVVSCEEAAAAKAISLASELKTLLLSSQKGFVAVHLPGDAELALRKVKRALQVRKASLASPAELESFGLMPGTVCALKDPIWSLPHLISTRLLEMDKISTNNGTLRGFYLFHPSVLLEADSVMIGDFEARPNF